MVGAVETPRAGADGEVSPLVAGPVAAEGLVGVEGLPAGPALELTLPVGSPRRAAMAGLAVVSAHFGI